MNFAFEGAALIWFAVYSNGILELQNAPGRGQPSEANANYLKTFLNEDAICEVAEKAKSAYMTVVKHLWPI